MHHCSLISHFVMSPFPGFRHHHQPNGTRKIFKTTPRRGHLPLDCLFFPEKLDSFWATQPMLPSTCLWRTCRPLRWISHQQPAAQRINYAGLDFSTMARSHGDNLEEATIQPSHSGLGTSRGGARNCVRPLLLLVSQDSAPEPENVCKFIMQKF